MAAAKNQSFGEQAARFSLYAPFLVLVMGTLILVDHANSSVVLTISCINFCLLVTGFAFGLIALFLVRRYGRDRILTRAIIGIVFNGMLLAVAIIYIVPPMLTVRMHKQLAGRWRLQEGAATSGRQVELTLYRNGKFDYIISGTFGTNASPQYATMYGVWTLSPRHTIGLSVEHVGVGNHSMAGKTIDLGMVKKVDKSKLTLNTDKGEEVLVRVPGAWIGEESP